MSLSLSKQQPMKTSTISPPPQSPSAPPPPPPPPPFHGIPKRLIRKRFKADHSQNLILNRYKPSKIVVIDESGTTRDDWVISIRDKIKKANKEDVRASWGLLCIYKVPHYLHKKDNKSYFPQVVSLGPYHHREEQTRSMECHKWRAVNRVLERTELDIQLFIDAMTELEEKARACYQGFISLSSFEFTEMLVLDGCFVLEILRGAAEGFSTLGYNHNDQVFVFGGLIHAFQRDMLLLENQLPLFVLNRLLELQSGTPNQSSSVVQLAVSFFNSLTPTKAENSRKVIVPSTDGLDELHCLDVFRRSLLFLMLEPKSPGERRYQSSHVVHKHLQEKITPTVIQLRDAGFGFRGRDTDRFWDIKFHNCNIEIPTLLIHEGTKSLFSNLIAFEQCHIDSTKAITSYIIFMDNLIDTAEDIGFLRRCGIIEHSLGSDSEVADMFNKLCQKIVFNTDDTYLSHLLSELSLSYGRSNTNTRKWNAWKTAMKYKHLMTLKQKYFDNPWAYLAFFVAVILVILTFSQTYFAAYDYFNPSS